MAEPFLIRAALGAILFALVAGSLASIKIASIRARMVTWWVLSGILVAALAFGAVGVTVLFALISFLALREFLSVAPTRRADRPALLLAYAMVPVSYGVMAAGRTLCGS